MVAVFCQAAIDVSLLNKSDLLPVSAGRAATRCNIFLTAAHWHYRIPTDEDIRMQVFGSLVYGAQGIAYYKFMSESLDCLQAPDLGNFRGGPLDEFRRKTPPWDHL